VSSLRCRLNARANDRLPSTYGMPNESYISPVNTWGLGIAPSGRTNICLAPNTAINLCPTRRFSFCHLVPSASRRRAVARGCNGVLNDGRSPSSPSCQDSTLRMAAALVRRRLCGLAVASTARKRRVSVGLGLFFIFLAGPSHNDHFIRLHSIAL
jgi:hypothetical protein